VKLLAGIGKRFAGRPDAELVAEIDQLKAEQRAFHREHNGRIKDDAHARIECLAAQARGRVDAWIAAHAGVLATLKLEGPGVSLLELANLKAATDPELLEKLHAAIDGAPAGTFSAVTRADFDRKLAELDAGIRRTFRSSPLP